MNLMAYLICQPSTSYYFPLHSFLVISYYYFWIGELFLLCFETKELLTRSSFQEDILTKEKEVIDSK